MSSRMPIFSRFLHALAVLALAASASAAMAAPELRLVGDDGAELTLPVKHAAWTSRPDALHAASLRFPETYAPAMKAFFTKHLNRKVRVEIGADTLLLPTVRAVPDHAALELSLTDEASFQRVSAALAPPQP